MGMFMIVVVFFAFIFIGIVLGGVAYYRKEASKYKHVIYLWDENKNPTKYRGKLLNENSPTKLEEYVLLKNVNIATIFKKNKIHIAKPDTKYIYRLENGGHLINGSYYNGVFTPMEIDLISKEIKAQLDDIAKAKNYIVIKQKEERLKAKGNDNKLTLIISTIAVILLVGGAIVFTTQYSADRLSKMDKQQEEFQKNFIKVNQEYIKQIQENTKLLASVIQRLNEKAVTEQETKETKQNENKINKTIAPPDAK